MANERPFAHEFGQGSAAGHDFEDEAANPDYDEQLAKAVLVTCEKCQQAFYMTRPQSVCIVCRRKA